MTYKRIIAVALALMVAVAGMSCSKREKPPTEAHKLTIVTSLFPLYDFVKNIGREKVEVNLLMPPGVEPHSFEPKPADIANLNKADIFIYTNKYMEPWAANIIKGMDSSHTLIIDSSKGIKFIEESEEDSDSHGHEGMDPHIWLDLGNAIKMVDNISEGLIQRDPANKDFYRKNAAEYKAELETLDKKFQTGLSSCKKKTFINGGHFAFGYLARRYGLTYMSAYGFSPDAEPTPGQLIKISKLLEQQGLKYIFYEELITPRVADTLARETGAQLLFLHGAHNISKEEFEKGTSFVKIMEQNLANLETGLECR